MESGIGTGVGLNIGLLGPDVGSSVGVDVGSCEGWRRGPRVGVGVGWGAGCGIGCEGQPLTDALTHEAQLVEPIELENLPMLHAAHEAAPPIGCSVPAEQGQQREAPLRAWYCPGPQFEHEAAFLAEYVPARHFEQLIAPAKAENMPAAHREQGASPLFE